MSDPFSILGVDENATDEEIKQRYLAMVRAYPPDREPARFQVYRAAYEALCNERKRLEIKLLAPERRGVDATENRVSSGGGTEAGAGLAGERDGAAR